MRTMIHALEEVQLGLGKEWFLEILVLVHQHEAELQASWRVHQWLPGRPPKRTRASETECRPWLCNAIISVEPKSDYLMALQNIKLFLDVPFGFWFVLLLLSVDDSFFSLFENLEPKRKRMNWRHIRRIDELETITHDHATRHAINFLNTDHFMIGTMTHATCVPSNKVW